MNDSLAGPAINVGALNEYIQSNKNTLAKRIQNNGDATAFIRVTVDEIVFSGESYSEKPLDADELIKGQGTGMISSPARLIVPAGGTQTNRLLMTGDRSRERYYRVRYVPVVLKDAQDARDFNVTDTEMQQYREHISAGVSVLTGFGAIITVLPSSPRFSTSVTHADGRLKVSNNGNASVIIQGLKECSAEGSSECSSQSVHQLRPGMRFERKIPTGKSLHYSLIEGQQKSALIAEHH